ncbi:MAG: 7-carboxy-7-deazaguanine synthase QueE [Porphyromonadaceae bacterium]|nr:MAG: 7-carboxy-7-deazaguanine synthase QueE [Porphyromonadaceae bacterium]
MTSDLYNDGHLLPVMEEFYSLQGEGFHTGTAAYFLRIGGCDIGCNWCDSKASWSFGAYPLVKVDDVVDRILKFPARAMVVTGGEPTLYPLHYLGNKLKEVGINTFIETSGAYPISGNWDWVCLSPKPQSPPVDVNYLKANELKVIIEKSSDLQWAEENAVLVGRDCHLFLQPEWSQKSKMLDKIIRYIESNPRWRLSLQAHKYIGIP